VSLLGSRRDQREAEQERKAAHRGDHDDDRHRKWIAKTAGFRTSITRGARFAEGRDSPAALLPPADR
jgi:hypothetical protein